MRSTIVESVIPAILAIGHIAIRRVKEALRPPV
jgi:hypothetical protein